MSFKQTFNNYYVGNENGIEREGNCYSGHEYNCCLDTDERRELRALHQGGGHLGAKTSYTGSIKWNVEKRRWEVWSYWTLVAYFDNDNGNWTLHRTWEGWSRTTAKHIDDALQLFNLSPLNKKDWLSLPVEEA